MDTIEGIVAISVAIIGIIGAYLGNAAYQRRFALTEQLWIKKTEHLTALFREQMRMKDLVKFLSFYKSLTNSTNLTPSERAFGFQQILNDFSHQFEIKYQILNPNGFDFLAPLGDQKYDIVFNTLASEINRVMPIQANRIMIECYEVGMILDDLTIFNDSIDFVRDSAIAIAKTTNLTFDVESALKDLNTQIYQIRKKARRELTATMRSSHNPGNKSIVVYGVEI